MIEEIYAWFSQQLTTNDVFAGLVGGSLVASLLYQAKSLPKRAAIVGKRVSTSEMTFVSTSSVQFNSILKYFQSLTPLVRQSKYSLMDTDRERSSEREKYSFTIGYGKHIYFVQNKFCMLDYWVDTEAKSYETPIERIKLTFISRNPKKAISAILKEANKFKNNNELEISVSERSYWSDVSGIAKRPMKSVFVGKEVKSKVLKTMNNFLELEDYCIDRGIPWKVSYMFDGPAGTGKTSLCLSIASHFDLPIYYLSLGSVKSDEQLISLFSYVPSKSIILIEDVDCARREDDKDKESDDDKSGVTLSCLLNCLDGALTPYGRILLMTTNHYEKLDPALVRAGRVDHRFTIEKMSLESARDMVNYLRPEMTISDDEIKGMTGAELELMLKEFAIE